MKSILIPTDFSENASDALAYALEFVSDETTRIHIVHVIEPVVNTNVNGAQVNTSIFIELKEEAEIAMKALEMFSLEYFKNEGNGNIEIITKVTTGQVVDSINQEAKAINSDLIIMGTQGSNHNLLQQILGSISTNVLKDAPCPVILIPKDYKYQKIDTAVFTTNLDHGDPYELGLATKLLAAHSPSVRILYVRKPGEDVVDNSLLTFANYIIEHSTAISTIFDEEFGDDIESGIVAYSKRHDAKMIIMHKSKKRLLEKIFNASHTKNVVNKLEIPLLVLN